MGKVNDPKGILGVVVGRAGMVIEGVPLGVGIGTVGRVKELGKPNVGNVLGTWASRLTGAALTTLLLISIIYTKN